MQAFQMICYALQITSFADTHLLHHTAQILPIKFHDVLEICEIRFSR